MCHSVLYVYIFWAAGHLITISWVKYNPRGLRGVILSELGGWCRMGPRKKQTQSVITSMGFLLFESAEVHRHLRVQTDPRTFWTLNRDRQGIDNGQQVRVQTLSPRYHGQVTGDPPTEEPRHSRDSVPGGPKSPLMSSLSAWHPSKYRKWEEGEIKERA